MGRYAKREFQLGDWWVGQKPGSPAWHRCRFDKRTGQTSRFSLGTTDLQQAKDILTEWWIANTLKKERDAADVLLEEVLLAYYHQHAKNLPSGRRIKSSMANITGFFEGKTVKQACQAGQIDDFVKAMLAKGFARTYVNNLLGIIKAATNRAWKRGELASVPFIELIVAQKKSPKGDPLKPAQVASLLAVANKQTRMAIMLMLGTGCRPSTAYEFVIEGADFDADLVDLNPPGRVQTPKFRPVVKMPPSLKAYLLPFKDTKGVVIKRANRPIRRWETAWRNARKKAGLGNRVNPYSLRHTVARWLRSSGVPKWDVGAQLGHGGFSTTDEYAPNDPAYLAQSCAAIEKLMQEVDTHLRAENVRAA